MPTAPAALKTGRHLSDPAVMLDTLKLAYRDALDRVSAIGSEAIGENRLTGAQKKELGRRLARYWLMEELPPVRFPSSQAEAQQILDEILTTAREGFETTKRALSKGVKAAKDELRKRA